MLAREDANPWRMQGIFAHLHMDLITQDSSS